MKRKVYISIILSLTIGLCLNGCSGRTSKSRTVKKSTVTEQKNNGTSFDSLNFHFKKGDIVIINGWVLMGPKDFFDSVSINKNLFQIKTLNEDSAKIKFGNTDKRFYKVTVPDIDSLPKGEFIEQKLYKYLNPKANLTYVINSSPTRSYSNFLFNITNKKVEDISKLNSRAATALYGSYYGKNGALMVNINSNSEAQKIFRPYNPNSIGRKIILSDSEEYFSNKVACKRINQSSSIRKFNGTIKLRFKNSSIEFKDDTTGENYMKYSIVGENKKDKWILIKGQSYYRNYFYLVNQRFNKVDTLAGEPMIFGNKLLCKEGAFTDSPEYIELWSIEMGKLKLVKKFSLIPFDIFVDQMYLKENTLYVEYNSNKYLKLKL